SQQRLQLTVTRNRERRSCCECRRRKLKCDRGLPCGSCVRRSDAGSCTYQQFAAELDDGNHGRHAQSEARLKRLEQLIMRLAAQAGAPTPHSIELCPSAPLPGEQSTGSASSSRTSNRELPTESAPERAEDEPIYSGSTHWSAMLEDIQQLRCSTAQLNRSPSPNYPTVEPGDRNSSIISMLFRPSTTASLEGVLTFYLPPRQDVDRLISAYFRSKTISAPFIHGGQFRRQYEAFWQNQTATPPLWIAILFSICHISANTLVVGKGALNGDSRFAVAAAHCLVLGEYFRPKRFAVEGLLIFCQAQSLTSVSAPPDIGVLAGLLMRIATSMGYHRDPTALPLSFSPFETELRRRTWSMCMQLDLLIAFHLGVPSSLQFPTWDTKAPSNLMASDFDENMAIWPTSRPDSEVTEVLFYIAKHKIIVVFEKILRHTLDAQLENPVARERTVNELDAELRAVYGAIPNILIPIPMTNSVVDPSSLIATRLCLSFIYRKCLAALHRPYVLQRRPASILACYNASLGLVRDFADACDEFLSGGQAEAERWFISSINWQDYLFGATALCLVL
ncbi:hypothetical protein B0T26DRAFT_622480, partial [Lasiosphaeria miniovina]